MIFLCLKKSSFSPVFFTLLGQYPSSSWTPVIFCLRSLLLPYLRASAGVDGHPRTMLELGVTSSRFPHSKGMARRACASSVFPPKEPRGILAVTRTASKEVSYFYKKKICDQLAQRVPFHILLFFVQPGCIFGQANGASPDFSLLCCTNIPFK